MQIAGQWKSTPQIWSQLVSYRRRTDDYGLWLNTLLDGSRDQIASVTMEDPFSMEVTLEGKAEEGSEDASVGSKYLSEVQKTVLVSASGSRGCCCACLLHYCLKLFQTPKPI